MKRILFVSAMIISSFGMMNVQTLSAAPVQGTANHDASPFVRAKKLVSSINQVVFLRDAQFSTVNEICVNYFTKLDELTKENPADLSAKVAALKEARNKKIKAALAADQQSAWATFKEDTK